MLVGRSLVSLLALSVGVAKAFAQGPQCPEPPAPVVSITSNSFYSDAKSSIIDPAKLAARKEAMRPVEEFESELAKFASRAFKGNRVWGECTGRWLSTWAKAGALTGASTSTQAVYEREWALVAMAMAYLKAKPLIGPEQRIVIEPWLQRVAVALSNDYATTLKNQKNNHFYWFGFALAATGKAIESRVFTDRSRVIFNEALRHIASDGHLPNEAARGAKALHYHNFALLPLVMIAEIGVQDGLDLYARGGGALHRLAGFVLAARQNPAPLARIAGTMPETLNDRQLGWIQFYARRFPQHVTGQIELTKNAHWEKWIGGDMKALAEAWVR